MSSSTWFTGILTMLFFQNINTEIDCQSSKKIDIFDRNERALVFPQFSSFGYIAAVAIPLDLPGNTYLAFTFEANYGLPNNNTHVDFVKKWKPEEYLPSSVTVGIEEEEEKKRSIRTDLFSTRTNFFSTVSAYFQHFGFNGTDCLLRTICEISRHNFAESNGVFGTLLHILFLPSTSSHENLPNEFYLAEKRGRAHNCKNYKNSCSISLIDLLTQPNYF